MVETPTMKHPVEQVVGSAAWVLLQAAYGGSELRVPKTRESKVWRDLMSRIGATAADRLIDIYGGDRITVPIGAHVRRRERIAMLAKLKAQGMTPDQIAMTYTEQRRLCSRTVKRMLAIATTQQAASSSLTLDLFAPQTETEPQPSNPFTKAGGPT